MEFEVFKQLAISFLLGLLIGIQRERTENRLAGMRTFPMIAVFGTLCGLLATHFGAWILIAGMLCLTLVCVIPHLVHLVTYVAVRVADERRSDPPSPLDAVKDVDLGVTTLVAILLMFTSGVLITMDGMLGTAVAVGGGIAILLHFKKELHSVARRLADSDMRAIMQFVLITCIILPVLPNERFGPVPYQVINLRESWLMVVLIVGMSLFGYIVYMFFGRDAGVLLGGILGGSISSTATTVSACRQAAHSRSAEAPASSPDAPADTSGTPPPAATGGLPEKAAAIMIMIASTVVFVRIMIEIIVVCPEFFRVCVGPLAIMMGAVLLPAGLLWFSVRKEPAGMPQQKNPAQFRSALTFGLLYTLILFLMAVAQANAGEYGMMFVAALSGMTDMDAITLSTSRMAATEWATLVEKAGPGADPLLAAGTDSLFRAGWKLLILAAMGNLVFKLIIVRMMAERTLFYRIALLFAIPFATGCLLLVFWPFQ